MSHRNRPARILAAACVGLTLSAAAASSSATARGGDGLHVSDLAQLCRRGGGELDGDGSIRPTCHDVRLRSGATRRAAIACVSNGGQFSLSGDGRRGEWVCDLSAL